MDAAARSADTAPQERRAMHKRDWKAGNRRAMRRWPRLWRTMRWRVAGALWLQ